MVPAPSTAARRMRNGAATGEVVLMGALLHRMEFRTIRHAESIEGYGTACRAVKGEEIRKR
jgi:hypothetical protein